MEIIEIYPKIVDPSQNYKCQPHVAIDELSVDHQNH